MRKTGLALLLAVMLVFSAGPAGAEVSLAGYDPEAG